MLEKLIKQDKLKGMSDRQLRATGENVTWKQLFNKILSLIRNTYLNRKRIKREVESRRE